MRFSKDGSALQLTAVDGRRATVTLPNDPELVDTLAKNGARALIASLLPLLCFHYTRCLQSSYVVFSGGGGLMQ